MPIQHIAEQQDGPLTGREQLQDGEEGERDAFMSAIACRRVLRRLGQLLGRGSSQVEMNATYQYLDLVPKGRDEQDLPDPQAWVRHHDRYED